jgi:hypothetical protein
MEELKPGTKGHMQHYAKFAAAAYNRDDRMKDIPEGYMLDAELTNRNRAVYYNPSVKSVVLALRGTDLKSKEAYGDLGTDALLALNMRRFSARFNNATKTAKAIETKYADYRKTASGHSLGASSSNWVGRRAGWDAVSYAAHTPVTDIHNEALTGLFAGKRNKKPGKTVNYSTPLDPVSVSTWLTGKSYTVKPRVADPHSIMNYM